MNRRSGLFSSASFPGLKIIFLLAVSGVFFSSCSPPGVSYPEPILLAEDGGWCWFQDPRVVARGDTVLIASVANGRHDSTRAGDIDAILFDAGTKQASVITLEDQLQPDDHNAPAFLLRPDNRWLAVYTRHGNDEHFFYRISDENNAGVWSSPRTYAPGDSTRITYSNTYLLEDENNRIYNFFRGLDNSWKPSYAYSDDLGESWQTGNIFIDVPGSVRHRPYVRYRGNGTDEIHMIYTEGHPRNYPNSIYHIFYRNGMLHHSDGTPLASLREGLEKPEDGTKIFGGSPENIAWTTDITLDSAGLPHIVFSVKKDTLVDGEDQRYFYGRWDGSRWQVNEMAYAGSKLYPGENEYTGLAAIHPHSPEVVYISTDADPVTGDPLISNRDGERHYEIFCGESTDDGKNWNWVPVTKNSANDNLRPVIADGTGEEKTVLVWLRGEYRSYTDYNQDVVGMVLNQTSCR